MSLDTTAMEDSIITELKTIIPRVYISSVPDGVAPVYPYIVVYFGEPMRIASDRGIVSTRNDTLRAYATCEVVAPTDDAARKIVNKIRLALTGFRPTDSGEMGREGGGGYSSARKASELLYYRSVGFSWLTNLSWNS